MRTEGSTFRGILGEKVVDFVFPSTTLRIYALLQFGGSFLGILHKNKTGIILGMGKILPFNMKGEV
ncbi:MAG: hypothetical protein H8D56_22900 [Planctomycetes bacterium]|nr:hypothetical protein [Planctomycetota bacterium]MBL7146582.1 hypothetical protein [Phycisphaerae bacterium]